MAKNEWREVQLAVAGALRHGPDCFDDKTAIGGFPRFARTEDALSPPAPRMLRAGARFCSGRSSAAPSPRRGGGSQNPAGNDFNRAALLLWNAGPTRQGPNDRLYATRSTHGLQPRALPPQPHPFGAVVVGIAVKWDLRMARGPSSRRSGADGSTPSRKPFWSPASAHIPTKKWNADAVPGGAPEFRTE